MSKPQPRPARHLLVFAVSLVVLVAALAVFLFAVQMEDTAPGKGVITSARILELRSPAAGRLFLDPNDDEGPASTLVITRKAGELIAEGEIFAALKPDGAPKDQRFLQVGGNGKNTEPGAGRRWRVVEVPVHSGQRVAEGDLLARFVEVDPQDPEQIREPLVRLDIEEKYFGEVTPGKEVRIYSNMYHHRVYGIARGRVDRLEPAGEAGPNGGRVFHAWVAVTHSPFPLKLGSTVRAEVLVGRKATYQIILEH